MTKQVNIQHNNLSGISHPFDSKFRTYQGGERWF